MSTPEQHCAELLQLAASYEVCHSISYDRAKCEDRMMQSAAAMRAGAEALSENASLVEQVAKLRGALGAVMQTALLHGAVESELTVARAALAETEQP